MKSPVANYSAIDATASSLIALISIKLYNLPPTKAVKNEKKNKQTNNKSITLPDCQLPE